jgi:hypothetical protein
MKKLLLSAMLLCGAYFTNAQAVVTTTSYSDNFDDNTLQATATDGWYGGGPYAVSESGGKLQITATNADQYFIGFGAYYKIPAKINVTSNKKLMVDISNPSSTQTLKVRMDLKLKDPGFTGTNCPAALADSISANFNVTTTATNVVGTTPTFSNNTVTLAPSSSATVTFDYSSAQYEYDSPCDATWTPLYYTIADFTDLTGLYIVVNPGAGESWCTGPECTAYTGTITFDNLKIGSTAVVTGILAPSIANSNMTITPNPASSEVLVSYSTSSDNLTFNVTDVTGKVVRSIAGNGSSANINVTDLAKGMYFVTTISNNAPVSVSKLVVE